MVPNESPYSKTLGLTPKPMSKGCPEAKLQDLVRHEIFLKMPIIVNIEVKDPAVSHLKLELWTMFS